MNELIEKLKDKKFVRAFGLMEEILPGSQECFKKVGKKNCIGYLAEGWIDAAPYQYKRFSQGTTYAIKLDYKPEPEYEYVDVEIVEFEQHSGKWLGVPSEFLPYQFTHLHCLPSLPNFVGFWCNPDRNIPYLPFVLIAKKVSEGKKVFARFRTGGGH